MQLAEATAMVIEKYGLQPWFKNTLAGRPYAKDIIEFIAKNQNKGSRILELGCGITQNLAALSEYGFFDLWGIEYDVKTFLGAVDLCDKINVAMHLGCGDAEFMSFYGQFDVIMPLNWTYQRGVNIPALLENLRTALYPRGNLIIDIIDAELSSETAPEYVQRFTSSEFEKIVEGKYRIIRVEDYFPRHVYYLEKP